MPRRKLPGAQKTEDIQERKPHRYRPGHQSGVFRQKDIPNDMKKKNLRIVHHAVDWYNSNHEGHEIEMVELIVTASGLDDIKRTIHINFKAKHKDDNQSAPKRFLAALVSTPHGLCTLSCVELGQGSAVKGCCNICPSRAKIYHPPTGSGS